MPTVYLDEIEYRASGGSLGGGAKKLSKTLSTTGNTATAIFAFPLAEGEGCIISYLGIALKSDGTAGAGARGLQGFRRQASGNVALLGVATNTLVEDSAGSPTWTFTANTTDQQAEITCTGVSAEDWKWEVHVEVLKIKI